MFNINNHLHFIGTVAAEPETVQDSEGAIVKLVLECLDNFLRRDGSASVQTIPMELVVEPGKSAPEALGRACKGALVAVNASLVNQEWTTADGAARCDMKILVDGIEVIDAPERPAAQQPEPAPGEDAAPADGTGKEK